MSIDKNTIEENVGERVRETRWWPFKDKNVEVNVALHVKIGKMGLIILRVRLDDGSDRFIQFPYYFTLKKPSNEIVDRVIRIDEKGYLIEAPYVPSYFKLMSALVKRRVLTERIYAGEKITSTWAKPLSAGSTNSIGYHKTNLGLIIVKSYTSLSSDNIEPLMITRLYEKGFKYSPKLVAIYMVKPELLSIDKALVSSVVTKYIKGVKDSGKPFADEIHYKLVAKITRREEDFQGSASEGVDVDKFAERIGRIVADMHYALNVNVNDEFFGLETIGNGDVESWMNRIDTYAKNIVRVLVNLRDREEGHFKDLYGFFASSFEEQYSRLRDHVFDNLNCFIEAFKGRVHGDLHFLQMVKRKGIVYIVDFEGEPHRVVSVTVKEPVVRDIATLCNSLVYIWFFQYKDVYCSVKDCWKALCESSSRREECAILNLGKRLIEKNNLPPLYSWVIEKSVLLSLSYGYRVEHYKNERGVDLHGFKHGSFTKNYASYLTPWIFERALYEMWYELSYRPYQAMIPFLTLNYPPLPYIKCSKK